jgi:hypothetical protein
MSAANGRNLDDLVRPVRVPCGRYTPVDPVALSSTFAAPNHNPHGSDLFGAKVAVSGIVGDNSELMADVAKLWILNGDVVADVTWGKGVFWRKLDGMPTIKHDLRLDGVDCRKLPEEDANVDVLVLDPPYRPSHGGELPEGHGLETAYALNGTLDTMNDVLDLYRAGLREAARVVKHGGRVLVKCQDMSYGHRLHLVSLDVLREMVTAGFEMADQFVLVNTSQLGSGQWEKQERARRSHSVLWVGVRSCRPNRPASGATR